jgi:plasmid maintenance system antidote protein VapI
MKGHCGISTRNGDRLHEPFGGGADTWFRRQTAYDLRTLATRAASLRPVYALTRELFAARRGGWSGSKQRYRSEYVSLTD